MPVPLIIRLIGTNEKEGRALLEAAGIDAYTDLTEAVKAVVSQVPRRKGARMSILIGKETRRSSSRESPAATGPSTRGR